MQEIGPERLSLARLQREAAARGFDDLDMSSKTYTDYMFRLADLPTVIEAFDPPECFRTMNVVVEKHLSGPYTSP